jgi:four helix bundle protein
MTPQDLRNRTQQFALDVSKFCDLLPKDPRTQDVSRQLHNAANSVAMNYRAACRARSAKEFIAKLGVVVEEADEAEGWIDQLVKTGKARGEEAERLHDESAQLLKVLAASRRTVTRNAARREAERKAMREIAKSRTHK